MVCRLCHVDQIFPVSIVDLCMESIYLFLVHSRLLVYTVVVLVKFLFKYDVTFLLLFMVLWAGDVESNPGPMHPRQRQCRVMYGNVRRLYGNINDIMASSR